MGEAQNDHDRQSCFPDALYSARLLWKVLSQTKVIVSVLKADRVVRRKISVRTRTREWVENGCEYGENRHQCEGQGGASGLERMKSKTRRKVKTSCYLCKLHHSNFSQSVVELPWPSYPSTPSLKSTIDSASQESLTYLPITRTQPPSPPRRSTSLPYYKILKQLTRLQVITGPHLPLSNFRLSRGDGFLYQCLAGSVMSRPGIFGEGEQDDHFGSFLLQASYSEPSIRHLLLAVGSIHLSRSTSNQIYGSGAASLLLQNSHLERRASHHYSLALGHLNALLSSHTPNKTVDAEIWETCFISIYLLTVFHKLSNNETARVWARTAVKVLRRAFRSFRCKDEEHGMDLPGCMREVALAFGRLDVSY